MSQGSSRPPLLPPIPFRIYLPPRKTKFQALRSTLHPALWFSADFFLFLFSDAARSSTVIFETSDSFPFMTINLTAHLLTPAHSRAIAPSPARVCGVRQSVICGTSEPPAQKSNRYVHFFWTMQGSELQRAARAHSPEHLSDGTTVKGPDVPARARRACVSEDRRKENRKELVAPFCDR